MRTALLLTLALLSLPSLAEDAAKTDPKKQEMMKKLMEASTPGAAHKALEPMAGKWKYTSKWWESAEAKPEESGGTSTIRMIFGGRFLLHETKGKAMGMPFEGMGLTGYNNVSGRYETSWYDSMSTGMMRGEGTFDAKTRTLSDAGEFACPVTESKKASYRGEWRIVDANTMVYSMYGHGLDGKSPEFKQMEMVFKRVK
jgi:hypothetical protein